ncbi:hypothetical protein CY34DRAFT_102312, partial [Suillus luteus UH-Slu-Lm8-n1]
VNSIVLLTNGISFAIQAALLLLIGAWADYGTWRPNITVIFTLAAVAVSFAWLGVEDPSKWQAGVALYILGCKCRRGALTFWTATFPGLVRHLPEVESSAQLVTIGGKSWDEHAEFESLSCNRVSNISFMISSIGEILILVIMVGILKGLKAGNSTTNNTKVFSVLIAFSSALWLLCVLPWFFLEERRPGLALPPSSSFFMIGFRQTYIAKRQCMRLKQMFLYLIFYFLMRDILNTSIIVLSIVSYSTLQLTLLLIVGIIIAIDTVVYSSFWLVQKKFKISTKMTLSFNVIWILVLTVWGLIGIHTNKFGFKHTWEIWFATDVFYGLMVCPWYSYSQTVISEVSPLPQMHLQTHACSKVGKISAFIGPLVSSAIITASGNNNNMPFTFLFGLGTISTMFLYLVDVKKSQMECDEFVRAEADLHAFQG